jgi:hypothetical protein
MRAAELAQSPSGHQTGHEPATAAVPRPHGGNLRRRRRSNQARDAKGRFT